MALEDAIKEAYASAPTDTVILNTIEIHHPSFVTDSGSPTAIRVVMDHVAWNLRLESGAPLDGGQIVEFIPFFFDLSLPPEEKETGIPEAILTIDNATRDIVAQIERALTSKAVIQMIYRAYLSTDTSSGPQNNPPAILDLKDVNADVLRVTARAIYNDPRNRRFPAREYTAESFPGLARQ